MASVGRGAARLAVVLQRASTVAKSMDASVAHNHWAVPAAASTAFRHFCTGNGSPAGKPDKAMTQCPDSSCDTNAVLQWATYIAHVQVDTFSQLHARDLHALIGQAGPPSQSQCSATPGSTLMQSNHDTALTQSKWHVGPPAAFIPLQRRSGAQPPARQEKMTTAVRPTLNSDWSEVVIKETNEVYYWNEKTGALPL